MRTYENSIAKNNVSIVDEIDSYLNLNGLLYSFVSLKELPDATFPGILRELVALDFPIVVSAQLTIPDQTKVLTKASWAFRYIFD